jgi:purine-nucleoside phosphorylase
VPAVVCFGRVHFYEGHPWERVTRLVELAADLGVSRLILTNAAGGLHPDLNPGDVMLIAGQVELLGPRDWLTLTEPRRLYDPELLATLRVAAAGAVGGTYAGLTGPCYETPAEIRALAACGVDAVGMSTVREAAAGMARGLRVAGLTCVTNKAAGLAAGTLHHAEVEATARRAAGRMATLIAAVV